MKLSVLLGENVSYLGTGNSSVDITGISIDSRTVKPGYLFIALRGTFTDGHTYILDAIERGASAVLSDRPYTMNSTTPIPYIKCKNCRELLPKLSDRFFGSPSKKMYLIGVTGTNGKTTTTHIIHHILQEYGYRTGLIGTNGYFIQNLRDDIAATTPEAHVLNFILKKMVMNDITHAAMEVSSHALEWNRVDYLDFNSAIFTNLSQDHLDFHKNMANYLRAKRKLFEMLAAHATKKESRVAILNAEDPSSTHIAAIIPKKIRTLYFGNSSHSDVKTEIKTYSTSGSRILIHSPWGKMESTLPLPGYHNILNALGALCSACISGVPFEIAVNALETLNPVPGRMEPVNADQDFLVIVDYAHTPDALDNLLNAVRKIVTGKVITVFGCGGDRDRSKRPLMAHAVCSYSDYVIITSDNPRTESPEEIIKDILPGISKNIAHTVIENRAEAIYHGITVAKKDDAVVIAGKGHETYQIVGRKILNFDDREYAYAALKEKGFDSK